MLCQVHWLCLALPLVFMYGSDDIDYMAPFTKYTSEQQCHNHASFDEFKPYGIKQCLSKCLQLASCTHVTYHPKELICRTSETVQADTSKDLKSDEGWICWRKAGQAPRPKCLQGTRFFKASGQSKNVPSGIQEKQQKKVKVLKQVEKVTQLFNTTPQVSGVPTTGLNACCNSTSCRGYQT